MKMARDGEAVAEMVLCCCAHGARCTAALALRALPPSPAAGVSALPSPTFCVPPRSLCEVLLPHPALHPAPGHLSTVRSPPLHSPLRRVPFPLQWLAATSPATLGAFETCLPPGGRVGALSGRVGTAVLRGIVHQPSTTAWLTARLQCHQSSPTPTPLPKQLGESRLDASHRLRTRRRRALLCFVAPGA